MSLIRPPQGVLDIAAVLEKAGFETWCVGGAVRDALMGIPQLDWDLATAATPAEVQRLFRRTVPVGIRFGTVGVLDRRGRMHEVTTFRSDIETDGRHAVVRFGASLDEDLARRDFTINAIAYSPSSDRLHDPYEGRGDLERGIVRTVGHATDRMTEDRLRALRAIRFATRFGFAIDPMTWSAIRASAPHLGRLSPERVRQEFEKTMDQVTRPSAAIKLWDESGAFASLVPALVGAPAVIRNALDYLPLPGPPRRPRRRLNRLTALFLPVPAKVLPAVLRELRFPNTDAAAIVEAVRNWQTLAPEIERAIEAPEGLTARRGREFAAHAGRFGIGPLLRLCAAVWSARTAAGDAAPTPAQIRSAYRTLERIAYRDPIGLADLGVDGEDLIRAGIAPGQRLGVILRALLALVVEDPSRNTATELTAAALAMARGEPDAVKDG